MDPNVTNPGTLPSKPSTGYYAAHGGDEMFDKPNEQGYIGYHYGSWENGTGGSFTRKPILGYDQTTHAPIYGEEEDVNQIGEYDPQGNPLWRGGTKFTQGQFQSRQNIANMTPDQRKQAFQALQDKYKGRMDHGGNWGLQLPEDADPNDVADFTYLQILTSSDQYAPGNVQAYTSRNSIYNAPLQESDSPEFWARYGLNDPNHVSPYSQSQAALTGQNGADPRNFSTVQGGRLWTAGPAFQNNSQQGQAPGSSSGTSSMPYNYQRPGAAPITNQIPGNVRQMPGNMPVTPPTSMGGRPGNAAPTSNFRMTPPPQGSDINPGMSNPGGGSVPYGGTWTGGYAGQEGGGGGNSQMADFLKNRLTGFQGYNDPLAGDTQNLVRGMLKNPSPYDSQMLKDNYNMLNSQLDEQYKLGENRINEIGAQRGLYDSTNIVGQLGDSGIQHERDRKNLVLQLLTQRAQQYSQDQANAVGAANSYNSQGLNAFTANEGAYSNRINQATGYDNDLYNRSLQSAMFNNQMSEQDREFWLKLLGY